MATNTHRFKTGERFDGQLPDETIVIREVREHTIVWDYIVNGDKIGRRTLEKESARTLIKSGAWKEPVPG